jgi:hypothetical protein
MDGSLKEKFLIVDFINRAFIDYTREKKNYNTENVFGW